MKKENTTFVTFQNYSVSGISRSYKNFTLKIPGHAIGEKAVTLLVPDHLITDISEYLKASHPAITMSVADSAPKAAEDQEKTAQTGEAEAAGSTEESDTGDATSGETLDATPAEEIAENTLEVADSAPKAAPVPSVPPAAAKQNGKGHKKGGGK